MKAQRTYSTKQVAQMVGIRRATLHKWQKAGKVGASHSLGLNGNRIWLWTDADIRAVRRYKKAHYWQGGGRKKKKQ